MCDKCVEIDKKIEHYRLLASRLTDQPTIDGIKELIERMWLRGPRSIPTKSSRPADPAELYLNPELMALLISSLGACRVSNRVDRCRFSPNGFRM
jgi:hypothetical protein